MEFAFFISLISILYFNMSSSSFSIISLLETSSSIASAKFNSENAFFMLSVLVAPPQSDIINRIFLESSLNVLYKRLKTVLSLLLMLSEEKSSAFICSLLQPLTII